MQSKSKIILAAAILLAMLIASVVLYWTFSSNAEALSSSADPNSPQIYGIVIDAGSTGTRILAFEFAKTINNKLLLKRELWKQEKPGLSSLTPQEAAQQLTKLLGHAEKFIPEESWKETPLKLKATAGFRLLEPTKSAEIFIAIRRVLRASNFSTASNYAEIIDGSEEGMNAWFAINYLRNSLDSANKIATLDLGGASTQVAFEIAGQIPDNLRTSTVNVKNFDSDIQLYVNSYLKLGLMAVRHAIITKSAEQSGEDVLSDCINSEFPQFEWKYQGTVYKISPKSTETPVFDSCVISVKEIVSNLLKPKVPSLQNQTINAFSYFFERSLAAQLIKDDDEGEEIAVEKFKKKAAELCDDHKGDDPWLCLDMTYLAVLFEDGYGLSGDKKVRVSNVVRKFFVVFGGL